MTPEADTLVWAWRTSRINTDYGYFGGLIALDADETHVISAGLYLIPNDRNRIRVAKALTSTGTLQIHKTFKDVSTNRLSKDYGF